MVELSSTRYISELFFTITAFWKTGKVRVPDREHRFSRTNVLFTDRIRDREAQLVNQTCL
jgi:hypothetical protein